VAGGSVAEFAMRVVGQAAVAGHGDERHVRYRLSPYSLRALRFVREIAEGESTVSGARLGSIAHAVRRLADMTSPDRFAQAQRIDEEIAELQRRKQEVLEGRGGTATAAQLGEQLREVLAMTRSLPADFRQLR
jgi:Protein of unknown function (DUF3375)